MIERIVIENFKSLRKVDLALGRVNLFIGTNASGKSNFLEALRVLEGIGNGFTINEILNGKPKGATNEVWEGVRGGSAHACLDKRNGAVRIEAYGNTENLLSRKWKYQVCFSPKEGVVTTERMKVGPIDIDYDPASETGIFRRALAMRPHSVLGKRADDLKASDPGNLDHPDVLVVKDLKNVQRMNVTPDVLREYSQPTPVRRMGNRGENFAGLVKVICEDKSTRDAYLSWLRQVRPEEIDDVGTLSGAVGEPMFMLRENGREFPAPVLSDGTLRFAAITAAFFQPDMPSMITFEEIENGIHASRVQLLLELLRSQAEYRKTQVVATTHSATVLDWLEEDDYKTTFFCKRDESTGESKICSLADVPHFVDVARKTPASELFAEGWLEMTS